MSYTSHKHHAKHHAKHPRFNWGDTSQDYPVYSTTMEPMQYQSYCAWGYPGVALTSSKNYEEQRTTVDARRAHKMECGYYPHLAYTTAENNQVNEDVDKEAEDFIKLEHKKFEQLKSIKNG
ncbi:hypothetical protein PTKIN_Ptkin02bG0078300 [Pterospermum kingtungense]